MSFGKYFVLIAGLWVLPLSAAPIYSTFGPGNSFPWSGGSMVGAGNLFGNGGNTQGEGFTASITAQVDTYAVALLRTSASSGTATGYLMSDVGGLPGAILDTFTFTNLPDTTAATASVAASTAHPTLSAGSAYWLVISAGDPLADVITWFYSPQNIQTPMAYRYGTGPWSAGSAQALAFGVDGTASNSVPEPVSMLTAACGLLALGFIRRRRL